MVFDPSTNPSWMDGGGATASQRRHPEPTRQHLAAATAFADPTMGSFIPAVLPAQRIAWDNQPPAYRPDPRRTFAPYTETVTRVVPFLEDVGVLGARSGQPPAPRAPTRRIVLTEATVLPPVPLPDYLSQMQWQVPVSTPVLLPRRPIPTGDTQPPGGLGLFQIVLMPDVQTQRPIPPRRLVLEALQTHGDYTPAVPDDVVQVAPWRFDAQVPIPARRLPPQSSLPAVLPLPDPDVALLHAWDVPAQLPVPARRLPAGAAPTGDAWPATAAASVPIVPPGMLWDQPPQVPVQPRRLLPAQVPALAYGVWWPALQAEVLRAWDVPAQVPQVTRRVTQWAECLPPAIWPGDVYPVLFADPWPVPRFGRPWHAPADAPLPWVDTVVVVGAPFVVWAGQVFAAGAVAGEVLPEG